MGDKLTATTVEVTEKDLPLHCPMPNTDLWDAHPRVFIDLVAGHGKAQCPYCGTVYQVAEGVVLKHGH